MTSLPLEKLAARLSDSNPCLVAYDWDRLDQGVQELKQAFASNALHTFAIKACPIVGVLRRFVSQGLGLEAASIEEVWLALTAGCAPEQIFFDSPAKTRAEIKEALQLGLTLSIDSENEWHRVSLALREFPKTTSRFLMRLNPQVAPGSNPLTSVASNNSQFGFALNESTRSLLLNSPWIHGVHVHIGSQSYGVQAMVSGIQKVWHWLNRHPVDFFNIGGGLPVSYRSEEQTPSFAEYAAKLRAEIPGLFADQCILFTEFGRKLAAPAAIALSRVESVKTDPGGNRIAVLHLGADFALRRMYQPGHWWHEFEVMTPEGHPKTEARTPWTLTGPLCFAGDVWVRNHPLPPIEEGDIVLIRDVGAYTLAMWSNHCNRAMPEVVTFALETLLPRESRQEITRFWSRTGDTTHDNTN